MSVLDRLIGFPNTLLQLIQACTDHACSVADVWDPTGTGKVRLFVYGLGGSKSKTNWTACSNSNAGPNKEGASPSGLWNPARIGEQGFYSFPGGKVEYGHYRSRGVAMTDKGNAGSRRA